MEKKLRYFLVRLEIKANRWLGREFIREDLGAFNIETTSTCNLIHHEQRSGKFRPVCASCDFYRSIYHQPKSYRRGKVPTQGVEQFMRRLESRNASAARPLEH